MAQILTICETSSVLRKTTETEILGLTFWLRFWFLKTETELKFGFRTFLVIYTKVERQPESNPQTLDSKSRCLNPLHHHANMLPSSIQYLVMVRRHNANVVRVESTPRFWPPVVEFTQSVDDFIDLQTNTIHSMLPVKLHHQVKGIKLACFLCASNRQMNYRAAITFTPACHQYQHNQ